MDGAEAIRRVARIALLCPQSRLQRLLRLSLVTDGCDVVEWSRASRPKDPGVDAVVADLDSLRHGVQGVLTLLRDWCVPTTTPVLFISVYPLELHSLRRDGPYDGIQPPFSPEELTVRVRRLFERGVSELTNPDPPAARRGDGVNGTTSDSV